MLLKENKFQRARPSPLFSKIDRHVCFIVKDRSADGTTARGEAWSPTDVRSYSDRLASTKTKSGLDPEILCRRFTLIRGFLVFDGLTLIERAKARPLDCRNMNEHIFAAALRLNESIPLSRIEPFDGTDRH